MENLINTTQCIIITSDTPLSQDNVRALGALKHVYFVNSKDRRTLIILDKALIYTKTEEKSLQDLIDNTCEESDYFSLYTALTEFSFVKTIEAIDSSTQTKCQVYKDDLLQKIHQLVDGNRPKLESVSHSTRVFADEKEFATAIVYWSIIRRKIVELIRQQRG